MDGNRVGIEILLVALVARMTRWSVGGRRSHPLVSFSALRCEAITGRIASEFFNLVATSRKTPVRPVWYCGAVLADARRLSFDHC